MELSVLDKSGKDTGRIAVLADSIFKIEPNEHAVYLDVKHHLANKRQGTHKAKERAEIAGSTKKLKKQKGTGTARAGSIKSPVFVGGGRIFGPRPRDYSFKLNKKVKQLARKSALSSKASSANIAVIEDFSFDAPKTKEYLKILENLSAITQKTLLILPENNKEIYLSSRNIPKALVLPFSQLNTYDILNADKIFITESSVSKIENLLS